MTALSDGIRAAAGGITRGARSGAWKGVKIGASIGATLGSFCAAAVYWDLCATGGDPFSARGVVMTSGRPYEDNFHGRIIIFSVMIGLLILITGSVFCAFIGTILGAVLRSCQSVYRMLRRQTIPAVHILPLGDLFGGQITSTISGTSTPLST